MNLLLKHQLKNLKQLSKNVKIISKKVHQKYKMKAKLILSISIAYLNKNGHSFHKDLKKKANNSDRIKTKVNFNQNFRKLKYLVKAALVKY